MRIYLRALQSDDYLLINQWRRDPGVTSQLGGDVIFVAPERERRWVESKIFDDQRDLYLSICLQQTHEMIGYLSVVRIDWRNRNAEWGGLLIGQKNLWNKGIGAEATRLLLEHVFFEMGMHHFWGYWLQDNPGSIRVAEKWGFKREGLLRQNVFKGNRFRDLLIMGILKEEFEAARRSRNGESS